MESEVSVFPVAGWSLAPIKAYEAVMLRLDYLTNPLQPPEEALHSPNFLILAPQVKELIEVLQRTLQTLESAEFQPSPGPRH